MDERTGASNPTGQRRPIVRADVPTGRSTALVRRHAPQLVGPGRERPITVDQTHHSVVVDDAVIVKWLVPPTPPPHHALDTLAHLAAVGFDAVPQLLGAEFDNGCLVAMATTYVPNACDGWDWFVDQLTDYADGISQPTSVLTDAERIGELAARLHLALATPSDIRPEPMVAGNAGGERIRCEALLTEALDAVENAGVDDDIRATLHARRSAIALTIAAMPDGETPVAPIHGDLHVGQILRCGSRLVVVDFDGSPLLDPTARAARRPMAVDVASLVQSIDHAGRIAQRRRPEQHASLDQLTADAVTATMAAYRTTLGSGGCDQWLDSRLLAGLRAAQELHEIVYAVKYLPHWTYAPAGALRAMFPIGAGPVAV